MGAFGKGLLFGLGQGFAAKAEREHEMEKLREQERIRIGAEQRSAARSAQIARAKTLHESLNEKATSVSGMRSEVSSLLSQAGLSSELDNYNENGQKVLIDSIASEIFDPDGERFEDYKSQSQALNFITTNSDRWFKGEDAVGRVTEAFHSSHAARQSTLNAYNNLNATLGGYLPSFEAQDIELYRSASDPNAVIAVPVKTTDKLKIEIVADASQKFYEEHYGKRISDATAIMMARDPSMTLLPVIGKDGSVDKFIPVTTSVKATDNRTETIISSVLNPTVTMAIPSNPPSAQEGGVGQQLLERQSGELIDMSPTEMGETMDDPSTSVTTEDLDIIAQNVEEERKATVKETVTGPKPFSAETVAPVPDSIPIPQGTQEVPNSVGFVPFSTKDFFSDPKNGNPYARGLSRKKLQEYRDTTRKTVFSIDNFVGLLAKAQDPDFKKLIGVPGSLRKTGHAAAAATDAVFDAVFNFEPFGSETRTDLFRQPEAEKLRLDLQKSVQSYMDLVRPMSQDQRIPVAFYQEAEKAAKLLDSTFLTPEEFSANITKILQHQQRTYFQLMFDSGKAQGKGDTEILSSIIDTYAGMFGEEKREQIAKMVGKQYLKPGFYYRSHLFLQ